MIIMQLSSSQPSTDASACKVKRFLRPVLATTALLASLVGMGLGVALRFQLQATHDDLFDPQQSFPPLADWPPADPVVDRFDRFDPQERQSTLSDVGQDIRQQRSSADDRVTGKAANDRTARGATDDRAHPIESVASPTDAEDATQVTPVQSSEQPETLAGTSDPQLATPETAFSMEATIAPEDKPENDAAAVTEPQGPAAVTTPAEPMPVAPAPLPAADKDRSPTGYPL